MSNQNNLHKCLAVSNARENTNLTLAATIRPHNYMNNRAGSLIFISFAGIRVAPGWIHPPEFAKNKMWRVFDINFVFGV